MSAFSSRFAWAVLACLTLAGASLADSTPEPPSSRQQVAEALGRIQRKYGRDAVKLESHLLNFALQGGSVLEASVGIRGTGRHEGKTYMKVKLDTGIVYNSSTMTAAECPARIWTDIVDPTLRQFETIEMRADGVVLHIAYQYGAYEDRDDLNRRLSQHALSSDIVSFRLLSSDVLDMVHQRIPSSELLRRSAAALNGQPREIELQAEPTPPPTRRGDLLPSP